MINETVEEIEQMQTHSSSVVAMKAAEALLSLVDGDYPTVDAFVRTLERNSRALRRANPSHASLQNTQREIVQTVTDSDPDSVTEAKAHLTTAIDNVIDEVEHGKRRAAENAVDYFDDSMTLLTHDYSSTVLEALDLAVDDGMQFEVYVTEARPRYLGRKAARVLSETDCIDTHLIIDSAAGQFLKECDRVVIGMDCIVEDTLYNRVGTYSIAATARDVGVPVTVIGSAAKIIESGFAFENERRSPSEVMREPARGFTVENHAYDATPTRLLDSVITDKGVIDY